MVGRDAAGRAAATTIEITVGWGDCMAGCIERHVWTYEVSPDGTVELIAEQGDPVPADLPRSAAPAVTRRLLDQLDPDGLVAGARADAGADGARRHDVHELADEARRRAVAGVADRAVVALQM